MFPTQEQDPACVALSVLEDDPAWMHEIIRHACNEDPTFRPALLALHRQPDEHYRDANATNDTLWYLQATQMDVCGRPSNVPRIKAEAAEPVLVKKEERDTMLSRATASWNGPTPAPEGLLRRADMTVRRLLAKAAAGALLDERERAALRRILRAVQEMVKPEV
ncbi:hypothetical protein PsYK624_042070 [Phanerochaete sordida]|uniref:Uncharacterized protein n=1 Tax=Phanerochaete sordida TaxID=48140 RepID=A0A9P3G598_9APHY|nr:hypothetical protein PsYK624_042070 [Phanerochaete sordida]